MSEKSAIKALQDIGLTEYEARVYTALVKIKTGIASEIHLISGIPRSAVYGALNKLEERGIVEVQHTKPMQYKVISPAKTFEKFRSSFLFEARNALAALEDVYRVEGTENQSEESMWMCRGGKNVYDKVLEQIKSAHEDIYITAYSVLLNLGTRYQLFQDIKQALADALKRSVTLRIICGNEEECKQVLDKLPGAHVRTSSWNELEGCLILVDKMSSLVVIYSGQDTNQTSAISTEGSNIVSMFQHFAEALWERQIDKRSKSDDV
ncbi:MAG: TrmB family transcriptional regulator [Methanotrichaceae archaeon]